MIYFMIYYLLYYISYASFTFQAHVVVFINLDLGIDLVWMAVKGVYGYFLSLLALC